MNNHPMAGLQYLLDGFKLIFKPGLRRFVIIPVTINIALFIGLFFLSQHFFGEFNQWLNSYIPTWLRWIDTILWILFFTGYSLIFIYTFVTLTNVISAPFNSLLSEEVERYLTGKSLTNKTWFELMKDIPRTIGRQLAIIGYYLPRAIVLLILFLVPTAQIIAAPLWFVFNAWFMTMQYIDYPTDNHRVSLHETQEWLAEKRWLSLCFGSSVLIATMIPLVNFVIVPAAVAGATKLWLEEL